EQQGGKSDQEPPQKTAPNKATDVSDSSATKQPTSDRQAGAPGALTGAAENAASASSTIPQVESFGLISAVDDDRTPTETDETPQRTAVRTEARPVVAPWSNRMSSSLL